MWFCLQTRFQNVFGNDWVLNEEECDTTVLPPVDGCDDPDVRQRVEDICYIFINPDGPLGGCSDFVDVSDYYDACVFDLCFTDPDNDVICGALQEYVQKCRGETNGILVGDWRASVFQCGFECPTGTVYESCGSACQPSCADPDADLNCGLPCREICSCPEGLLDDGGTCVQPEDCGCTLPDGSYISAGDVYVNDDCSEMCSCSGGTLECVAYACVENQECRIKGGVRDCYCRDGFTYSNGECTRAPGICTVWGDPHYTMFDGGRHDFQGDCEYTLVRPCSDRTDLVDFHLWGDNVKNNPSDRVSYLRKVVLEVNGTSYSIERNRVVLVNGARRTTPLSFINGVTIRSDQSYATIQTSFGLSVRFDGANTATIEVPYQYWNATCGLCGTFDDDRSNDFRLQDGSVTRFQNVFGNDWVLNEEECDTTVLPPVDGCDDPDVRQRVEDICYIFINPDGPLGGCSDFVDVSDYYDACVFDLCFTDPDNDVICGALQEYVQKCRGETNGILVGDWRASVFQCGFECPTGTVYESCGSACQPSCADPDADLNCGLPCREICSCPEGLLDDGGTCVQPEDCGCTLPDGSYISAGDVYVNDDCSEMCSCSGGTLECVAYACVENQECRIKGGVRDCYCRDGFTYSNGECTRAPGICTVWGDPHYTMFDGGRHDFQGDCEYTLVRPCSDRTDLVDFHLWGDNVKNNPSDRVSYLRKVVLEVNGTSYSIERNRVVLVNGARRTTPLSFINGVTIRSDQSYATIQTSFGLSVRFDGANTATIEVPYQYWNATCGLCGTFDDDRSNDFRLQDGSVTRFQNVFGNDWVLNEEECDTTVLPPVDGCDDPDVRQRVEDICYIFINPDGPLGGCADFVDVSDYYDACVFDLCFTDPDNDVICGALQEYVQKCRGETNGILVGDWRASVFQCGFECPTGTVYESCGSACQPSCADPDADLNCGLPCREICSCPEGLLDDGGTCVQPEDCGCTLPDGSYISAGDVYVNDDCSEMCSCSGGTLECVAYACVENQECRIKGGVRDCYCRDGFTYSNGECTRAPGICTVWGDPHYTMFDGGRHDFQGDCEYTLVRPCSDRTDLVDFHLWGDNVKNNPSDRVSYLRKVVLEVNGTSYSIERNRVVLVNGARRTTPLSFINGVTIRSDQSYATIQTSFGLSVRFDGANTATIEVPYQYWNATCGLCGTFDDDRSNDFRLQDGSVTRFQNVFGNDWVLNEEECDTTVLPPVDGCDDPDVRQRVEDICYIFINPDGPLGGCADFVDVSDYYDACVFDLCFTDPDNDVICGALQEYVQKCRGETNGILVGDWRASVFQCGFECPTGTVYESCGSACQPSCADPDADLNCGLPCREICSCPEGLLDDGGTCVQPEDCGCTLPDGSYISAGDVYVNDDCSEMCSCSGGTLECVAYACVENQECRIKGGVRDCYCRDGFTYSNGECTRGKSFE
ncbi:zonadhesin-like [Diadema antillarum]|uniref:zonadhesin-like n=2 Tax=Diadema antillarum TaxID=105358 RepID=UPI003A8768D6